MDTPSFSQPGRAVALTLVLFLGTAIAMHFALRAPRVGSDTHRNPNGIRDWLHYVQATEPRRPDEVLVVLIGNSQGFGAGETETAIYATLLERELSRRWDEHVRLANWSVPAGSAPEFILVAAAARRLKPDWIVSVFGANNFTESNEVRDGRPVPISFFASDARHLLALRGVTKRLPPDFARRYLDAPALTDAWLARLWRPWVYREWALCRLSRCPGIAPFLPAQARREWAAVPLHMLEPDLLRDLLLSPVSESLLGNYGDVLIGAAPRQLFLQMPVTSRLLRYHKELSPTALSPWRAAGGEFEDWSRKIEDDGFRDGTHFNAAGHKAMARALADRMAP
jgi:hypothetical protein